MDAGHTLQIKMIRKYDLELHFDWSSSLHTRSRGIYCAGCGDEINISPAVAIKGSTPYTYL